jgi:hypothetical protein
VYLPDPDALEQLRRLGELRNAGVLTDAEFEAKKARAARADLKSATASNDGRPAPETTPRANNREDSDQRRAMTTKYHVIGRSRIRTIPHAR